MKRILVAGLVVATAAAVCGQESGLLAGASALQAGDYAAAAAALHKVVADPAQSAGHADAYLLLAKAHIALSAFTDATAALERYLLGFPTHRSYPEGLYLKGRLLYLQGEFENAILSLQQFLKSYPDSPFVPSALYWTGEALFALGRLDEALAPLQAVVQQWPESARAEAARYRASLIELHKREAELLKLLKLSHQETLRTIEEFQRKERGYEQALAAYRRRIAAAGSATDSDVARLEQQLAERSREVEALRARVDELTKQLAQANVQPARGPAAGPTAEQSARLLKAKEQALELKSRLMRRLSGEGRR